MKFSILSVLLGAPVAALTLQHGYQTVNDQDLLRNAPLKSYAYAGNQAWEEIADCQSLDPNGKIYQLACFNESAAENIMAVDLSVLTS